MQVHTIDKAALINELTVGNGINHAVHQRRRADFALMLAMFSGDVRDNTPVEKVDDIVTTDDLLRQRFQLQPPQALRNDQSSYAIAEAQATLFHGSGLASAKLSHYLRPDALTYLPEDTHNLPEEVYHNLSGHDRRHLAEREPTKSLPADLYQQLNTAMRCDQLRAQV
ncbi:VC2046/SO_2500 family protein [Vibrio zhugei]|uniref:VC2046/SO_2500 family protein n=1 Tax=Vibrio zhugei TaxID=2479546 RepID=A0ABV7CBP8_9VIBR|nr:VC2046/SO_2500 family protein [Vibrio zhugei]